MPEIPRIEEPPPIRRNRTLPPAKRSVGRLIEWRRPSGKPPEPASPPVLEGGDRRALAVGVGALAVIALQAWTMHRLAGVGTDLANTEAELEEARASLGLLWDTSEGLAANQTTRLAQLTDSIRSVFAYAEGELRLWDAAYYAHEQRLEENAGKIARNVEAIASMSAAAGRVSARLDELARSAEVQEQRLVVLEEEDRSQASALESLASRTGAQEATLVDLGTTVAGLRETLAGVDGELAALEELVAASGSAYGELDTRIEGIAGWVDGFRRAGLSGAALESRLSAFAEELRRVRMRVDSLRPVRTARRSTEESR